MKQRRVYLSAWPKFGGSGTENVAVATTLQLAEDTGKRHANLTAKVMKITDDEPRYQRHFRRVDGDPDQPGPRYWFEVDEKGCRLLFQHMHNEPGKFSRKLWAMTYARAYEDLEADRFFYLMDKWNCDVWLDADDRVRIAPPEGGYVAQRWRDVAERYQTVIVARLRPQAPPDADDHQAELFDPPEPVAPPRDKVQRIRRRPRKPPPDTRGAAVRGAWGEVWPDENGADPEETKDAG